jgi:poly(hydroxyalkanoate) granule-associated protein
MMAKVEVVVKEAEEEPQHGSLLEAGRTAMLAGIGAAALAQEGVQELLGKLMERGQGAEKEGRQLLRDVLTRRREQIRSRGERPTAAEDELEARMQGLLDRMNVPSKGDIQALSAKVTALTQKVDQLKQSMAKQDE